MDGWPETKVGKLGKGSNVETAAALVADEEQKNMNVDGLNDEIFRLDESVERIGQFYGGQTVTSINAEVVKNVPETRSHTLEVFGQYGYCFPINSTFDKLSQTAVEVETIKTNDEQRDVEMEIDTLEQND